MPQKVHALLHGEQVLPISKDSAGVRCIARKCRDLAGFAEILKRKKEIRDLNISKAELSMALSADFGRSIRVEDVEKADEYFYGHDGEEPAGTGSYPANDSK